MSRLAGVDDWLAYALAARYQSRRLAALCGVSDRHLRRFSLEKTGLPTQHWLDEVRLWKSLDRLLHEPLSRIKEISFDLGFSSQQRFCLRFARRFGICPSRLRGNEHVVLKAITASHIQPYSVDGGSRAGLKRLRTRVLAVLRAKRTAIGGFTTRQKHGKMSARRKKCPRGVRHF